MWPKNERILPHVSETIGSLAKWGADAVRLRYNTAMSDVTRILMSIDGAPKAADELLPLVYQELRKLAADKLAREKPGQTIQATVLVHEAWLRLVPVPCVRRQCCCIA